MATLYRSDLESIKNSAKSALSNEALDTPKIITAIERFISTSNDKLKGDAWDQVRSRLNIYLPALEKRKTIATNLINAINASCAIMENYLNEIPSLQIENFKQQLDGTIISDDWFSELTNLNTSANNRINEIKNYARGIANSFDYSEHKGISWDDVYNQNLDSTSINHYNQTISDINTLVEYIGKLQSKDAEAYALLENVISEMRELNTLVANINDLFVTSKPEEKAKAPVYEPDTDGYYNGNYGGNYGGGATLSQTNTTTSSTTSKPPVTPEVISREEITERVSDTTANNNNNYNYSFDYQPNNSTPINNNQLNETIDNVDDTNNIDIINDVDNTDDNIVITDNQNPTQVTTNNKSNGSTMKKVGGAAAVLAAAGAAGYAGYNLYKKSKENDEFKSSDDTDDYNDNENIDIKYDNDEI